MKSWAGAFAFMAFLLALECAAQNFIEWWGL
jgi:hypothetical protein